MSVCLSVDHERELGKNGWTDRDAVWDVNSGRPNELCIRWDPGLLQENETNVLRSRFNKCPTAVKCVLFRSHCICLYDAALWRNHTMGAIRRLTLLRYYFKCIKLFFFGYKRTDSVTNMLFALNLPSFNTILHNSSVVFKLQRYNVCNAAVVRHLNLYCST